jgi:molybdopterin converting factor small subunit
VKPIVFVIPGPLRELAGNREEVKVTGPVTSLGDALAQLWRACPAVRDRVLTDQGDVRPHVNIFVDGENSRQAGGLRMPVREGAEIMILPAVSGGSNRQPRTQSAK